MQTLKVISALLSYPDLAVIGALDELRSALDEEALLPRKERAQLDALLDDFATTDLMELQERYVVLFDRGRALSLHLFEHVHGESRDRGQAMVDLLSLYRKHGFDLGVRELPDYVPLFLEYLSEQPADEARVLLDQATPILALLGARLAERESSYHVLFAALTALTGKRTDADAVRAQAASEGPDETLVNMDKIWEEEAVRFMASPGCESAGNDVRPVHVVRRDARATEGGN